MKYCQRCVNPENLYGDITFDKDGVCNYCRSWENDTKKFTPQLEKKFINILEKYRSKDGSNYDMIIPVSGGKDSLYQVHLLKRVYGFNPLLVTFNHTFNTRTGIYNMTNMVEKLGVDHIRFTPNPQLVSKLVRKSIQKFGDTCWHCHCGIFTFPLRIAVAFKIKLLMCQEPYYGILSAKGGKYTKIDPKDRKFAIRAEADEMIDEKMGIYKKDLVQWQRPSQKEIEKVGVRGILISDYIHWEQKSITEFLIKEYGFKTLEHDRTYDNYANVECHHCSGIHDYLRFLKRGYGRATDDAGIDIRKGYMTREQAIKMVKKYDGAKSKDIALLLKRTGISEDEFMKYMDKMRDHRVWKKTKDGWKLKDSVVNHKDDPGVNKVRLILSRLDTFKRLSNPVDGEDNEHVIM